ncbi:glycosyltransferase [Lonepinella sp. MS14435]|uniref:CgeB family protein n=1 Tax=Lonepinella sp. MS14435 TaxID=3003618 RepID=UPI0036DEF68D
MRIALIADNLTRTSLLLTNDILVVDVNLGLMDWKVVPDCDFLLVESAWNGYKDRWKYKIASYPDYPKRTNEKLVRLVEKAKDKGIPTVFWNKEDSVHFDRFIDSAKHFDHIFTVDENCIKKYRSIVPASTTVDVAMFPVQPKIHNFQGFHFKHNSANFVGSYNNSIHSERLNHQEMLFGAAQKANMALTVFDRNSNRKNKMYRYPNEKFNFMVNNTVDYIHTSDIYRDYLVSLNVNTITDSPTMFSRRVVEILACGGILVSTPSVAMEKLFRDYCHIVHSEEEAVELLTRLKYGATKQDLEKARAGVDFVLNNFTWSQFITKIQNVILSKK